MHTAALVPLLFSTACLNTIHGDGKVARSLRDVGPFRAVEAHGAVVVDLTVGGPRRVEVSTDANLLTRVRTEVAGGVLVIRTEGNVDPTDEVRVTIVIEALDRLDLSGASDATIAGLSGGDLSVDVSGASEVRAAGRVDTLTIDASGASDVQAGDVRARVAVVDCSGASDVAVHALEALDVEASGASNVEQLGPGPLRRVDTSGAATVETAPSS